MRFTKRKALTAGSALVLAGGMAAGFIAVAGEQGPDRPGTATPGIAAQRVDATSPLPSKSPPNVTIKAKNEVGAFSGNVCVENSVEAVRAKVLTMSEGDSECAHDIVLGRTVTLRQYVSPSEPTVKVQGYASLGPDPTGLEVPNDGTTHCFYLKGRVLTAFSFVKADSCDGFS